MKHKNKLKCLSQFNLFRIKQSCFNFIQARNYYIVEIISKYYNQMLSWNEHLLFIKKNKYCT